MTTNIKPTIEIISLSASFILACIIAVGLRLLAIRRIRRPMKIHDWLCIGSLIFCIGFSVDMIIGTAYGHVGKHMADVPPERLTIALKTFFASQFLWGPSITMFRLSMLLVYLEIFNLGSFRYYNYAMIGVVCLFYVASLATPLRMCQPIESSWSKAIPGTCGNIATAELAAASFNLVLDIVIVLLPLPLVWRLHITKERKIALTVTFALGLLISAINLGRIIQVKVCNVEDFTYCTHSAILLTIPEMAVGVIVTCVPLLGPLFYPDRYKTPDTSDYANLGDNARKPSAKLQSNKVASTDELHEIDDLNVAWDAIQFRPGGKTHIDHNAWAQPELVRKSSKSTVKNHVSDEIRVDTDIHISVRSASGKSSPGA